MKREVNHSKPAKTAGLASPADRRNETRTVCSIRARITVIAPIHLNLGTGIVTERSKSGLRVTISQAVYPGSNVIVHMPKTVALGEVRHCSNLAGGEFALGIYVTDSWTTSLFSGDTLRSEAAPNKSE